MAQKANRRYGQHFLTSPSIAARMVDLATVQKNDRVFEIGPGKGALTQTLLSRGARVFAIEIDRNLIPELEKRFAEVQRFQLCCADVLKVDLAALLGETSEDTPWRIVSNLPYNEATPILQRLTGITEKLHSVTVMVQREVADRLLAAPGSRQIGYITHLLGLHFRIQSGFLVHPRSFRPAPKVFSSVIQLIPHQESPHIPDYSLYLRLIQRGFAHRRKKLLNSLRGLPLDGRQLAALLQQRGLHPGVRAEALSRDDFIWLAQKLGATPGIKTWTP